MEKKGQSKSSRGGRTTSLKPMSPKAGVTLKRTRYSCGGHIRKRSL